MNWPRVALGDIFEIARGGSPRPIKDYVTEAEDGLNWIMIGDTLEGSKYIESTGKKIRPEGLKKSRWVNSGDFLLTNSMSFGRPYILKISGCIHDGWLVLSPRSDQVFPDFFYYLLGSKALKAEFAKRAAGAVVKNLNTKLVQAVQVPLPPLAKQKRIAKILDAADALRAKRRESLAQLDALLESTFLEMFGDPVENSKGWDMRPLAEVTTKIGSGATPRGGRDSYKENGISLIRSLNVYDGSFRWTDLAFIDDQQAAKLDNVVVESNDVLLNITGASVARCCLAPESVIPARVNQHVAIIRPKADLLPAFLAALLASLPMKRRLLKIAEAGATRQAITKKQIQELKVLVPPRELQAKFHSVAAGISLQFRLRNDSLTEFDALFGSLQARAFAGVF